MRGEGWVNHRSRPLPCYLHTHLSCLQQMASCTTLAGKGSPEDSSPGLVQDLPAHIGAEVQGTQALAHLGICSLSSANPKSLLSHKAAAGHTQSSRHSLSFRRYTHTLPSLLHTHTYSYTQTHISIRLLTELLHIEHWWAHLP